MDISMVIYLGIAACVLALAVWCLAAEEKPTKQATAAMVCVHSSTIRVSIGSTATAAAGIAFLAGDIFYVYGVKNLNSLSMIRESADATVSVQYFNIKNVSVI